MAAAGEPVKGGGACGRLSRAGAEAVPGRRKGRERAMGNYQVVVYAICKNEAKFARRWMASMGEADRVMVLDTGSEDGTAELLRELGAEVEVAAISPWRFDEARNRSLALVPEDTDICVCTDLDEVFVPGWRAELERAWAAGCNQVRYHYIWSFRPDGSDGISFWGDKIHARQGWRWVNPVHEVLRCDGQAAPVFAQGIRLEHHPDETKSRGSICRCWNWQCRRIRPMTGICTIWAGNTCFTAGGRRPWPP